MSQPIPLYRRERGATLVTSLIMLALLTTLAASSFSLSSTNLKSVTNTQLRDESVAAANAAIEQIITSSFATSPTAQAINIDLNNDGVTDYTVQVAAPTCMSSTTVTPTALPVSSLSLGSSFSSTVSSYYDTVFDIDATVSDAASGASAHVHQGVRQLLTQTQYTTACP